ncbi:MAG: ATP-binding cassette domain-containing protein [Spirochaetes bacterium]|nr:ATP-binding cassette domain-containing protein [Spirochaetota bacterium]
MIQISNLTKTFGPQILFDKVNLQINREEKLGLIGRNGNGKTTLFKIITEEDEADSGDIIIPKNYKIGYVKQDLDFKEETILKEAALGLPSDMKDQLWLVEKTLFGLGFTKETIYKKPSVLSGGFQVRLNLVKTLLSQSNLLLLDEPTNFLDITSVRWLVKFLKNWKKEILLITHDRGFMDEVITHTAIIHRKKIKKIKGNTSDMYNQIAMDEEVYERQRINDEKKRKNIEVFISRFRAKARLASLVQSRIKEIEKKEKKEKLEKLKTIDFKFNYKPIDSHIIMDVKNLTFSYDKNIKLINDLSFTVHNRDRIAVIGPNGKGKSTLMKLLNNEITPESGTIKINPNVKNGYFGQTNKIQLHPDHTIEEEISLESPDHNMQSVRDICGLLLFEGDDALKKIKVLSGGEKSRVILGKILISSTNLLLLDEPTNHFDLESCDSLLTAIDDFEGSVIIVTHNEMFLHALATRLIVFDNDKIFLFEGTYNEFLNKVGWIEEKEDLSVNNNEKTSVINKKEIRKKRALLIEEKSRIIKPLEKKYNELENTIKIYEQKNQKLQYELITASQKREGERIGKISKELHELEKKINEKYEELDKIMQIFEKETNKYEEMLKFFKD